MKLTLARSATVALAVLAAATAFSQNNPFKPSYVKAELGYPLSSDIRDNLSKNSFGVALGFNLPKPPVVGTLLGTPSIELGYQRMQGHSSDINAYSAQFVYRQPLVKGLPTGPFSYIGGGIGFQYTQVGALGTLGVSCTKTTVAGQVLLGMDFAQHLFVELGYHYAPDVEGVNVQTLSLGAGIRF